MKFIVYLVLAAIFILAGAQKNYAQEKVIQLYGVVRGGDSTTALPDASIFIKGTNRGTISNEEGIFSIAVNPGDKIEFSFIGYKDQLIEVPQNLEGNIYLLSPILTADTSYLPTAILKSLPSPAEFKRIFLDAPLVNDHYEIARENLNIQHIMQEMRFTPMDAQGIYNMHARADVKAVTQRGLVPSTGILNPLAWVDFVRSLKEGGQKE